VTAARVDKQRMDKLQKEAIEHVQEVAAARQQVVDMTAKVKKLERDSVKSAEERGLAQQEAAGQLCKLSAMWRAPLPVPPFQVPAANHDMVAELLRRLSHSAPMWQGIPSKCCKFQGIKIHSVAYTHSPYLWGQYQKTKEAILQKHKVFKVDLQPLTSTASFHGLGDLLKHYDLDDSVNEVILAHGCDRNNATSILQDGWDIRYTGTRGGCLYGEGMYFAREPCKCNQYTNPDGLKYIIIARVALGDPHYARNEYKGRHPPERPDHPAGARFDSIVVDPQYSQRGQAHWEYVLFDGKQAYPEMVISYEIPP